MHYNDCRIHQSLRSTPTMDAGVEDHVWSLGEVVEWIGEHESGWCEQVYYSLLPTRNSIWPADNWGSTLS